MTNELSDRSPDEIEAQISQTRASLDRKLEELEHRLSPREQLQRVTSRIHPEQYVAWAAVGAVAAGTYLAIRGWRQLHPATNGDEDLLATTFVVCEDELSEGL